MKSRHLLLTSTIAACLIWAGNSRGNELTAADTSSPPAFRAMGRQGPSPIPIPSGWTEKLPEDLDDRIAALPAAGLVVAEAYLEDRLAPAALPGPQDITGNLATYLTPGEYEPLIVAVYAPRGAANVRARVSALTGNEGTEIPATQIDLRVVRYIAKARPRSREERIKNVSVKPEYTYDAGPLEKQDAFAIPAQRTQHLWLTAYAPPQTAPGSYRGTLTISAADQETVTLQINVRVLPLRLPPPPRLCGAYMDGSPWTTKARAAWLRPEDWTRVFTIWREYGLNSIAFFPGYTNYGGFNLKYENGRVLVDFSQLDRLFRMRTEAGITGTTALDVLSSTQAFFDSTAAELATDTDRDATTLSHELFAAFIRQLLDHAQAHNWGDLALAIGEESTINPRYFRVAHQIPGAATLCIDNSIREHCLYRNWCERWGDRIDIRQSNYFFDGLTAITKAAGNQAWYYNLGWTRLTFGLLLDKLEATAYHMWAGEWSHGNPYNLVMARPPACWMSNYPTDTGPLSTPKLEIAREGIDDSRYLALLRKLIADARYSDSKRARQLAEKAEQLITDILAGLPAESKDHRELNRQQEYRRSCAEQRRKISAAAVELHLALSDSAAKAAPRPPPQPQPPARTPADPLREPQIIATGPWQLPTGLREAAGNSRKPGLPGFLAINTIDEAEVVWVPPTSAARGRAIREGAFMMGSDDGEWNEKPVHPVELDGFWMYRYEVTVGQWKKFLAATGYDWGRPRDEDETAGFAADPLTARYMQDGRSWNWAITRPDNFPIVRVHREDALKYAEWAGANLPTEAQWEWAGRGPEGWIWPWGDRWNDANVGFSQGQAPGTISPVDRYPGDTSWCGVVGLAGSVREWCCDDFSAYENFYANSPRRNPHSGGKWARAMIRGGTSLYGTPRRCRCAGRYYAEWHDVRTELNGFRLIVPVQGPEVQGSAQGHN